MAGLRRGGAWTLAVAMGASAGGTVVHAAPPPDAVEAETQTEAAPPPDPQAQAIIDRARRLYERGRAKFDTFDYVGAIDLWTRAYSELPESPQYRPIRSKLMFNIAAARVAAFDIDDNVGHLRQAKRLMDRYVASLEGVDDEEMAEARRWQNKIEQRLAEAEAQRKEALAATGTGDADDEAPSPTPVTPVDTGPDPAAQRRAKVLTIAGIAAGATGVAMLGVMTGGLVWSRNLEKKGEDRVAEDPMTPASDLSGIVDDGKTANALAIGAGVAGGVLTVTGVALVVTGQLTRRKANKTARVRLWPVSSKRMIGAAMELRF